MGALLTRKFRLHWCDNASQEQKRLHRFFQAYIHKANALIRYIFSLQEEFDASSPDGFLTLFKSTGTTAYNDLYTTSLDLKHFDRHTPSGGVFKQRTMRMLCSDIYYVIRNFLVRQHNLGMILNYLVTAKDRQKRRLVKFIRHGRLLKKDLRMLKRLLRLDCYGSHQSLSTVYLSNHVRQLRNLLFRAVSVDRIRIWKHDPSGNFSEIHLHLTELAQNLSARWPYPVLHTYTCSLPSQDGLWNVTETKHTVQFTFKPTKDPAFRFRLLKPKLRKHYSELSQQELSAIFSKVPTLQYASKGLTLCQPIAISVTPADPAATAIMGIDLGIKTLATCSIGSLMHETHRVFISHRNLLTTTVDPTTGKFIPLAYPPQKSPNLPRRLYNLRHAAWQTQQRLDRVPKGDSTKRLAGRLSRIWKNMRHLHQEIRNQISHKLVALAQAYKVTTIKFEDLRWRTHHAKRKGGGWISQQQLHWLHGEIISHTTQLARRNGIRVVLVDAYLSSQLDANQVRKTGKGRDFRTKRTKTAYRELLGTRRGKIFVGCPNAAGNRPQLDADLNAARNIRLRSPVVG